MSTRLFSLQAKLAFSSSSLRFHQQFSVPGVSATLAPLLALSSHATINHATTWSTAVEQGNSRHFSSCSGAVLPGLSRGTHGTSVSSWCRRPGHQLLHHSLLTTSSGCSEATAGSKAAASSSAGPETPAPTHGSTPSSASASNTSINSSANSSNTSSSRGDDSRLQVPPAVAAGAAAAGEAAAKAAKAAAKQVRWGCSFGHSITAFQQGPSRGVTCHADRLCCFLRCCTGTELGMGVLLHWWLNMVVLQLTEAAQGTCTAMPTSMYRQAAAAASVCHTVGSCSSTTAMQLVSKLRHKPNAGSNNAF